MTSQNDQEFIQPGVLPIWKYKATATRESTTGELAITITPGASNRIEIVAAVILATDLAAGTELTVDVLDTDDDRVVRIARVATYDNAIVDLGRIDVNDNDANITNPDSVGFGFMPYPVDGRDKIVFKLTSVAADETLSILIRARLYGAKPTVSVGASQALAASYDSTDQSN